MLLNVQNVEKQRAGTKSFVSTADSPLISYALNVGTDGGICSIINFVPAAVIV